MIKGVVTSKIYLIDDAATPFGFEIMQLILCIGVAFLR